MTTPPFSPGQVAETVAIQALSFLAQEPARLGRFLAETGLDVNTVAAQVEGKIASAFIRATKAADVSVKKEACCGPDCCA